MDPVGFGGGEGILQEPPVSIRGQKQSTPTPSSLQKGFTRRPTQEINSFCRLSSFLSHPLAYMVYIILPFGNRCKRPISLQTCAFRRSSGYLPYAPHLINLIRLRANNFPSAHRIVSFMPTGSAILRHHYVRAFLRALPSPLELAIHYLDAVQHNTT